MEKYKLAKVFDFNGNLDKRWYVEYKYLHPESKQHKKIREWISAKLLTKQARYLKAQEIKSRLNTKLKNGYNPFDFNNSDVLLPAAIDSIVLIKQNTCRKKTYTSYKSMTGKFKAWLVENKCDKLNPEEFSKQNAYRFLDQLLTVKKLENRTYNSYLMCMKTVFNDLMARDYLEKNVWAKIMRLPAAESSLAVFNQVERDIIKNNLPREHYNLYCVSMLIYNCFLRPAEIVRLQVKDLLFDKFQILVPGSKSKNKKQYFVTVPDSLVLAFEGLNLKGVNPNHYIFTNNWALSPGPTEMAPTRISEVWKRIVKDKLLVQKNIYDLKANGNGDALEHGIDVRQIQLQNRHYSLEQTQIYLNKIKKAPDEVFRQKMPNF